MINKILNILPKLISIKFLNKHYPLVVRWQVTDKCYFKCLYCKFYNNPSNNEIDFSNSLRLLKEMKDCGVIKISFSGGEPLLREDISELINYCKELKISPEMNTSGYLFPQKANLFRNLELLKISLDGPPEVHNFIRGRADAYNWAIESARAAKQNDIKFIFTTTLTKFNINIECIDFLLNLAKELDTLIAFQPLKNICYFEEIENFKEIMPSSDLFKKAINRIISYKKKNKKLMRNTLRGLRHIYNWPRYGKLKCWGGGLFCMISPNGEMSPCDRLEYKQTLPNCNKLGFREAFTRLPTLSFCGGCGFCGSLELNFLMALKIDVIPIIKKISSG